MAAEGRKPYPERWSVLLGDVVTNLRDALDHAFWGAVVDRHGVPTRAHGINFPVCPSKRAFRDQAKTLEPMVAPKIWEVVEAVQPFSGRGLAHTSSYEILRWLSNTDKHQEVHVVDWLSVDMGPVLVNVDPPVQLVENWRLDGPAADGDVIARITFRRPADSNEVLLQPTFGHMPSGSPNHPLSTGPWRH